VCIVFCKATLPSINRGYCIAPTPKYSAGFNRLLGVLVNTVRETTLRKSKKSEYNLQRHFFKTAKKLAL
jgi:hypothetical protein